jgi:hypothetical protein
MGASELQILTVFGGGQVDGCGSERVLIVVNHHLEIQTFLPALVTEMNQNPYIQLCSTNSNI